MKEPGSRLKADTAGDVFVLSPLSWNSVPQDVTVAATQAGHETLSQGA